MGHSTLRCDAKQHRTLVRGFAGTRVAAISSSWDDIRNKLCDLETHSEKLLKDCAQKDRRIVVLTRQVSDTNRLLASKDKHFNVIAALARRVQNDMNSVVVVDKEAAWNLKKSDALNANAHYPL